MKKQSDWAWMDSRERAVYVAVLAVYAVLYIGGTLLSVWLLFQGARWLGWM